MALLEKGGGFPHGRVERRPGGTVGVAFGPNVPHGPSLDDRRGRPGVPIRYGETAPEAPVTGPQRPESSRATSVSEPGSMSW